MAGIEGYGARRAARLWRRHLRKLNGEPTPPKKLGKKARRKQRQEEAIER